MSEAIKDAACLASCGSESRAWVVASRMVDSMASRPWPMEIWEDWVGSKILEVAVGVGVGSAGTVVSVVSSVTCCGELDEVWAEAWARFLTVVVEDNEADEEGASPEVPPSNVSADWLAACLTGSGTVFEISPAASLDFSIAVSSFSPCERSGEAKAEVVSESLEDTLEAS